MVKTPCEDSWQKGVSPTDGARGQLNTDVNLPGTPFAMSQAAGVSHAEIDDGIFMHSKSRILLFAVASPFIPQKLHWRIRRNQSLSYHPSLHRCQPV